MSRLGTAGSRQRVGSLHLFLNDLPNESVEKISEATKIKF